MHDSWTVWEPDTGQTADVVEESMHQRTADVARRGMGDHSGRLGYHCDMLVIENDAKRKILWDQLVALDLWKADLNAIPGPRAVALSAWLAIDPHISGLDEFRSYRS